MKKLLFILLMLPVFAFGQRTTNISLPTFTAGDTLKAGSVSDTSTSNSGLNSIPLRVDKHIGIIRGMFSSYAPLADSQFYAMNADTASWLASWADINAKGYWVQAAGVYLPIADSANYAKIADTLDTWFVTRKKLNDLAYLTAETGDISNVSVTSPITGGGASGSVTIGIADADVGGTKGAATFNAADFDVSAGGVSIDYTKVGQIAKLGLRPLDTTSIATNKILKFNGTSWAMGDDNTGGGGFVGASVSGDTVRTDSIRFSNSLKHTISETNRVITIDHATPTYGFELWEDWVSGSTNGLGNQGWTGTTNAGLIGTASVAAGTPDTTAIGLTSLSTSSSASGAPCLSLGSTQQMMAGGGAMVVEMRVMLPTTAQGITSALSDGTQTYTITVGLGTSNTGTVHTDGLFFRYAYTENAGRWTCVVRNNGTETATDMGGSAVALGVWYKMRIETTPTGSSATFTINGGTPVTPSGANIPRLRAFAPNLKITKSLGTVPRYLYVDYYYISKILTVAR
jgi:hypothetical protein